MSWFKVLEDGTLTALISDWGNVHTVPRCIGYSRYYPAWITRDWDPIKYGYGFPTCRPENSQEELDSFRRRYADEMKSLVPGEANDFANKSHLYEAVWIAASSSLCTDTICKEFSCVFSQKTNRIARRCIYMKLLVHSLSTRLTEISKRRY
jgi:hypothetical protein